MDLRVKQLAKNLVNYSCKIKEKDKVLIETGSEAEELVVEIVKEIYAKKAYPFVRFTNSAVQREILKGMTNELAEEMARFMKPKMESMDAYIGISACKNVFDKSGIDGDKLEIYSLKYSLPIHHEIRVKKTNWVILQYPTPAFAQMANKNTRDFEDFYFNVCNLDYSKMNKAMDALKDLMDKTDKVRIVGGNTDLTFSIKGIGAVKCAGEMNIPDGEVYTAPIKDSVNGILTYNVPTFYNGVRFDNVCLEFKDGKIIKATSSNTEALNKILDTDEGARYIGEFAIGVNPYIEEPMLDILFDEKIKGSFHFTPGACYDDAYNGNTSAVHWDMVQIQRPEYGGGEIWFDDRLIRKDGLFVIDELLALNPENLK